MWLLTKHLRLAATQTATQLSVWAEAIQFSSSKMYCSGYSGKSALLQFRKEGCELRI